MSPTTIAQAGDSPSRTLLLAPPSIASHEENLRAVLAHHDRSTTDLQMLDRLSANLASLPDATYDLILVLTDADGSRTQSTLLLDRAVFARVVPALKPGGKLQTQDGAFVSTGSDAREALLAGLVMAPDGSGFVKPVEEEVTVVPLKLGKGKLGNGKAKLGAAAATTTEEEQQSNAGPPVASAIIHQTNGADVKLNMAPPAVVVATGSKLQGVGSVDFSDDLDDLDKIGEDDELIDEDTLLTEEDRKRDVVVPPECAPRIGKRRRACKDCTCGLAKKLEAEDLAKRDKADVQLQALKLGADDLNDHEVDFTVKGKVGSCGNCSLGDAFRCDGCPYIGLPAFKPGEEVSILSNPVQL